MLVLDHRIAEILSLPSTRTVSCLNNPMAADCRFQRKFSMTPESSGEVSRRAALGTLGAAGGLLLLNQAVAQDNNPAAQVADTASSIRITGLKTHRVQSKVFVEILTNHKVTGWGEVSALVPAAAEELAKALFDLLNGENPTRIEFLWQKLYRAHRDIRGGPFMCHTLAGIDMALWDLTGKLWGVPVYRLLGGPCRDKVRVYPTAKAHKVPPHGIYEHSGKPAEIERMSARTARSCSTLIAPCPRRR
jgi:hypothetical protein